MAAKGILTRMASFKPKFITHKIKMGDETEQEFKFYPVPTLMLVSRELRESVGPIIEVLQSILGGPAANVNERHIEQTPDGGLYEVVKGASIPTIDFMENLRQKTGKRAVETFFCNETRYLIGRLLGASLRDEFPKMKDPEFQSTVEGFMDHENLDLGALAGFITGFVKANASVLGLDADGDLGKLVLDKVKEMAAQRNQAPVDLHAVTDGEESESAEDEPQTESSDPDTTEPTQETEGAESAL